jgi:galactose-1-phosphate uridylyltransferase
VAPDATQPVLLGPDDPGARCAFCPARQLETPPEKARLVLIAPGAGGRAPEPPWQILRHVGAGQLGDTRAEVRRIPNLFEILPLEYWQANHGYVIPDPIRARAAAYAADPAGRAHLLGLMRTRARASGATAQEAAALGDEQLLAGAVRFFDGAHDLVVARRHFVPGATHDDQLAGAGDLSPDEHHAYLVMAVDALSDLHGAVPGAVYVATFQNWLRAAGASFDHLHKQLVAIDELGPLMTRILAMLDRTPDLFTVAITDPAAGDRLVIAENDHAIALAGVGHRYPTVEVYSHGRANRPWEHDAAALRGVSDMLHAVHAATGRAVPTNEEWHYRPVGAAAPMPWRINVKWRVSTLAGFEGGTRINVNTISPADLRARMVHALGRRRSAGRIAAMSLGDECSHRAGVLAYLGG